MGKEHSRREKKFDLTDYIGRNNTIYDKLDKYLGIRDYTTENMLNNLRSLFDANDPQIYRGTINLSKDIYQMSFKELTDDLTDTLLSSQKRAQQKGVTPINSEERSKILSRLRQCSPDAPQFDRIINYIDYVKKNNFSDLYYSGKLRKTENVNPAMDKINKILIEESIKYANPDTISKVRHIIVKEVYCRHVKHFITENTPYTSMQGGMEKKNATLDPDWQEMNDIFIALSTPEVLRQYDLNLAEFEKEVAEFAEKQAIKVRCKAKRSRYVNNELSKGLSKEKMATGKPIEDCLFDSSSIPIPEANSYSWSFDEYKNPQVLLNNNAIYSENGIENQRVVAIGYGKFSYGTMFSSNGKPGYSSNLVELVGVTRVGQDDVRNYFVLVPLNTLELKRNFQLTQEDELAVVQPFTKNSRLIDYTNMEEYKFVKKDKIPADEIDFYSKIAFSDKYLSDVISKNSSFLGTIDRNQNDFIINPSYSENSYDMNAIRYALRNPGKVNGRNCKDLTTLLRSTNLLAKHMELVKRVVSAKEKTFESPRGSSTRFDFNQGDIR